MKTILQKKILYSKKFIAIILLLALFIGAAFYVYNRYISPKLKPNFVNNREFTDKEPVDTAQLYLIHATWCPHSKEVKPIWDELKSTYNRKVVNKFSIIFRELDGDKDEKEIDTFSSRFNKKIEGFPTIILIKQNEVIEFDANPTKENLTEFIKQTL